MQKPTAPATAKGPAETFTGEVWARPDLSPRDRSLITCAALVTNGSTEQLRIHLAIGKQNGLTETELKEAIIHLAFYAGRPFVTIWVVRAGDGLHVRSAYGTDNPWFRRAKASGTGRVRAGGVERDVTFTAPDGYAAVHTDIDAAYHAKYDRYGPQIVGSVVGPMPLPAPCALPRSTDPPAKESTPCSTRNSAGPG